MASNKKIEERGRSLLIELLEKVGRSVRDSDVKTFDLVVDEKYAEVKTKEKPFNDLDFIAFTEKQYSLIKRNDCYIFLVCNVSDPENVEIFEIHSEDILQNSAREWKQFYYNKGDLNKMQLRRLINE